MIFMVTGVMVFFKGLKRGASDFKRVMLIGAGIALSATSLNFFVNDEDLFYAMLLGVISGFFFAAVAGSVFLLRRVVKWGLVKRKRGEKYKRKVAKGILKKNEAILGKMCGNDQQH